MSRVGWLRAAPVVAYLIVFFAIPLAWFIGQSFVDAHGALTLTHYRDLFATPTYLRVLWITFEIAGITTLVSLLAGYPLAYFIACASAGRRNSLMIWVLLPFWTSFLVRTFVWLVILGSQGPVQDLLHRFGIAHVQLLYNLTGVTIGMVHALLPFAVLTMVGVMENIDPNLARAAQTMGAPPGQAFWRVYFPLSLPGVAAAGLLVFLTALGFFITPSLLGGAKQTMISVLIYQDVNTLLDWGAAGAVSVLLLAATIVVFMAYGKLLGTGTILSSFAGEGGADAQFRVAPRWSKAIGSRVLDALLIVERAVVRFVRPHGKLLVGIGAAIVVLFLVVPILLVLPMSLTNASYLSFPPRGLSGQWYAAYLGSPEWMAATGRSFEIGLLTMLLATVLGTLAAFALVRNPFKGSGVVGALILAPMICPRMVLAVALFYLYAHLSLVGTTLGLVLGHTVLAIPYVVVTVTAALKGYDPRLDQAALVLGATPWKTFRHVTFPVIRAGLISGALFAFITSFDDLNLALFLTGGLFTTLPKKMWDDMLLQVHPTLAVVSTLMVVLISFVLLIIELSRRRTFRTSYDDI